MVGGASWIFSDIFNGVFSDRGGRSRESSEEEPLHDLPPSFRALPTPSVCTKGFRRIQHPILVGTGEKNTLQTHLCTTHKKIPTHCYNSSFRTFLFVP